VDVEAKQWADLEKEMLEEADEPEAEEPAAAVEPQATEPEAQPSGKPEPTFEELKTNYKNLQAAVKQAREQERAANERLTGITQLIEGLRTSKQPAQRAEPEPVKIPDVNEDPIGHFTATVAALQNEIKQLRDGTSQTQQQLQQQTAEQQFWGAVQRSEEEMRRTVPMLTVEGKQVSDYDLACQHLEATRVQELELMLPDDSPAAQAYAQRLGLKTPAQARMAMLNQDRLAVAQQAMQLGISAADLYYRLAKQRGYQTPQANAKLVGADKGKVQIAAARAGQKAARTIAGGAGRSGVDNPMTAEALLDLYTEDPEAFDREWDKAARAGLLG
jgi:hypothetical protein